jgi:hypothetical protein
MLARDRRSRRDAERWLVIAVRAAMPNAGS